MRSASSHLVLTTGVSTLGYEAPTANATAHSQASVPLLAQYVISWIEGLEGLVLPSTVEAYAGRLQRHVLPLLGKRRLDEIGVDDILALISDLRKRGYSGTTVAVTLTPLSRLFTHSVRR